MPGAGQGSRPALIHPQGTDCRTLGTHAGQSAAPGSLPAPVCRPGDGPDDALGTVGEVHRDDPAAGADHGGYARRHASSVRGAPMVRDAARVRAPGEPVVIGTKAADEPTYARSFRPCLPKVPGTLVISPEHCVSGALSRTTSRGRTPTGLAMQTMPKYRELDMVAGHRGAGP